MAKKKKSTTKSTPGFDRNPFRDLKGFAVGDEKPEPAPLAARVDPVETGGTHGHFLEEMNFLGVQPLASHHDIMPNEDTPRAEKLTEDPAPILSDAELFERSLGQLDVRFADQFPDEPPAPARPRRLRQLERGRLIPNASLDLHGVAASLVAEKIGHFLQDARYQGWQTLLIVTGRGLHSPTGQTLVRDAAEKYLRQNAEGQVAEWGRAPRSYGGEGALAVFLKQSPPEKNA